LTQINKMTKFKISTLLGAAVLACASSHAQVLTFEGLQNNEPIDNFYNGGLGGSGSGPGPNYGITFGGSSLALIAGADGGSGNFSGNPSGDTIAYFLSGSGDVMNKAAGFTTGFSFDYASYETASVTVWSGLNGTGTELASLSLSATADPFNVWSEAGVTFAGTAESAVFGGAANEVGFDDITLGSSKAGQAAVPDTAGTSLYMVAGAGLVAAARVTRKQRLAAI
jgi:hypothetical protein